MQKTYIKSLNRVMLHHNEYMINFVIWQPYLGAILDFLARPHFFKFMPTVPYTRDTWQHFGI